jgi:hypothetical protein
MTNFIKATILENHPSAEYEDHAYTCVITAELGQHNSLLLFDYDCIGSSLAVGTRCEFVISPFILRQVNDLTSNSIPLKPLAEGIVIDTSWTAPQSYIHVSQDLYKDGFGKPSSWLLLETNYGNIIISSATFTHNGMVEVQKGQLIRWEYSRLDLLAINTIM